MTKGIEETHIMFKFDIKKHSVYCTTVALGVAQKGWNPYGGVGLLHTPYEDTFITTEIAMRYAYVVDTSFKLEKEIKAFKSYIDRSEEYSKETETEIKNLQKNIKDIKGIKVRKCSVSTKSIMDKLKKEMDKLKKEKEIFWPSFMNTGILDGIIQFPKGTEPFFYNTSDDTLKYDVGDLVEVTFGVGSRVPRRYKNQTVTFIVNNIKDYMWGHKIRKLALCPDKDNWTIKDILFIDTEFRFSCLMIDLFPENRRPFNGWRTKKVTLKKIGHKDTLPPPLIKNTPTLDNFKDLSKYTHFLRYNDYNGLVISVIKGNDHSALSFRDIPITTTKDISLAKRYLRSCIKERKEKIEKEFTSRAKLKIMLDFAESVKPYFK